MVEIKTKVAFFCRFRNVWEMYERRLRDLWKTFERRLRDIWEMFERRLRTVWGLFEERRLKNVWETFENGLRSVWGTFEERLRNVWGEIEKHFGIFFLILKLISTQCVEKEQKHKYGVYTSAISSIQKTFPRIDQSSRNSRENHKLCHTVMILLPPHY